MTTKEKNEITCTCGKSHTVDGNNGTVGSRLVDGWDVVVTMDAKLIDLCPFCYQEATDLAKQLATLTGNRYVSISHLTRDFSDKELEREIAEPVKEFEIVPVLDKLPEGYDYIAFSQSYTSQLSDLLWQTEELKGEYKGTILVDTVSKQGNNSNRLVEVHFDGEKFDVHSFELAKSASRPLRQFLTDYWKARPELMEGTVLNSNQVKLIMKGIPLGDPTL